MRGCSLAEWPTLRHGSVRLALGIKAVNGIINFIVREIVGWSYNAANGTMGVMPRGKPRTGATEKPKTIQRTYRFDTKVFEAFEEDCAQHLSNPKRVIEALILYWLDADPKARGAMAQEHRRRIGAASDED